VEDDDSLGVYAAINWLTRLDRSGPWVDGVEERSANWSTPTATESDSTLLRSPLFCNAENSCCALTSFVASELADAGDGVRESIRVNGLKAPNPFTAEPIECSFTFLNRLESLASTWEEGTVLGANGVGYTSGFMQTNHGTAAFDSHRTLTDASFCEALRFDESAPNLGGMAEVHPKRWFSAKRSHLAMT